MYTKYSTDFSHSLVCKIFYINVWLCDKNSWKLLYQPQNGKIEERK